LTPSSLKQIRKNQSQILNIMRAIKTKWNLKRQWKSKRYQKTTLQLNFSTLRNSNICHQDFIQTECQFLQLIRVIVTTNWVFVTLVKYFDPQDHFTAALVAFALKFMTITALGWVHVSVLEMFVTLLDFSFLLQSMLFLHSQYA
jgi:hypothetical protein